MRGFIILIFFSLKVTAQVKFGVVKDEVNQNALPFVSIICESKGIKFISNEQGKFVIKWNDKMLNDSFLISLVGYESKSILVKELIALNKDTLFISLKETSYLLPEVLLKIQTSKLVTV